jgi:hypothetical protein
VAHQEGNARDFEPHSGSSVKVEEQQMPPDPESLRTQLAELNVRARTYASQMWQVPFAYIGIVGIAGGAAISRNDPLFAGGPLVFLGLFGIAVINHMFGLQDGTWRAVEGIRSMEAKLRLEQTALHKPLVWNSLLFIVILTTIACLGLGGLFLWYGLK